MHEIKQKLVYILPEYRDNIATHFYHNVELLEVASKTLDIFLIVEKGDFPNTGIRGYRQQFRFLPLRVLELIGILSLLRIRGYRTIWTHYSFFGSIFGSLIFKKSFYWNCGMPWLYTRGMFEEYFFRLALRRSSLVTGTEGMKREYIERYHLNPERVHVLSNWINLARYEVWRGRKNEARAKLGLAQDAKVVLFLHRLSKRKGADFIEPVAKAFAGNTKVLFLVAGSGPLSGSIIGKNTKLAGEISQKDVPMYFAAADIFFMPSEEEGFPHVVLEAMALGVPIVSSDVGGVKEFIAPMLLPFVVKQNTDLFVQKITTLLADVSLVEKISQEEQEQASRFALKNICEKFISLVRG